MIKFLVTGANGDIAEGVSRILKKYFLNSLIHGTDALGKWPGKFYFSKVYKSPHADSKLYLKFLKQKCKKYDLIIPTTEQEIFTISKSNIPKNKILINSKKITDIFLDKLKSCNFLNEKNFHQFNCDTLKKFKPNIFPIYAKPRKGAGGQNHFLINNKKLLKLYKKDLNSDWILQDYLDSKEEFTCVICKFGKYKDQIIMRRILKNGITRYFETSNNQQIKNVLKKLNDELDYEGSINIQLKLHNNLPKIFEINPRISSTVLMRDEIGFKDLLMWINYKLKKNINIKKFKFKKMKVYRLQNDKIIKI
jgi:carbamoyl-phosphate synthase large subunit